MRIALLLPLVLLPVHLAGCGAEKPKAETRRALPTEFVEGSFVVSASAEATDEDLAALADEVGRELGCAVKPPERINWGDTSSTGVISEELAKTYGMSFEGCDFSQEGTAAILDKLAASASVTAVSAEAVAAVTPVRENDPRKGEQEHLPFIRRDQACSIAERQGAPVIVAVLDSGVDVDHPDLKDMMLRDERGEIVGANFVGSRYSMPPDAKFKDGNGHGTHVAGLIAATANNGQGVVGVASCANVKIMPIRVLGNDGKGSSIEIERGVKWAADKGAHILNLSLGYATILSSRTSSQFRSAVYADMASRSVIVLAAAGNDGATNGAAQQGGYLYHFPSSHDGVISVAATTSRGQLTSFSNRGDRVDIAAPGSQVLATKMGGGYVRMSGTSMATPVAAGAYALALATAKAGLDRSLDRIDPQSAESLMESSILGGVSLSSSLVEAGGVIDVEKMVAAAAAKYPKRTQPSQPTEPTQPTEPSQPVTPPAQPTPPTAPTQPNPPVEPAPQKPMSFVGLQNGQKPAWPQALAVENLPSGTTTVFFYWGSSPWSFTRVSVASGAKTAKDNSGWYFYGTRTLLAVAVDARGRILGTSQVQLKGY